MLRYEEILNILETEAIRLSRESTKESGNGDMARSLAVGVWHAYYTITDANKRREVLGR